MRYGDFCNMILSYEQLVRENTTLRNAQKACETCDGPTMEKVKQMERDLSDVKEAYEAAHKTLGSYITDLGVKTQELTEAQRNLFMLDCDLQNYKAECDRLQRELDQANENLSLTKQFTGGLFLSEKWSVLQADRDRWRKMAEELQSLIKDMDCDYKANLPEYKMFVGAAELLERFNAMKAEP